MKKIFFFISCLLLFSCEKDPVLYMLTTSANPTEGGTVLPASRQYESGDTANLVAAPAAEYVFESWTGATGTEETTLVMDADKTVVANFIKKKYPLTIKVEGEGTVAEKIIKAGASTDYNSGTIVELTANCTNKWKFKKWKGDLTGTENPKQITIDKPKTVTAVFEELPPFYLDTNGVTIKARDWVTVGTTGDLNGVTYTAVDIETLRSIFSSYATNWTKDDAARKAAEEKASKSVTTLITDMSDLFSNAHTGNSEARFYEQFNAFNPDISSWDVSNVTNMSNMFKRETYSANDYWQWPSINYSGVFNQDISKWDVSNVTNMSGMFFGLSNFNQDIGKWDVSKVTDMSGMFAGNSKFSQDISKWDVSNVTNMSEMFLSIWGIYNQFPDISSWDVSNVTNMQGMFADTDVDNIGSWNVGNVTDMSKMFYSTWIYGTQPNLDVSKWDVSKVTDMSEMFYATRQFNSDISSWNVSNVTDMNHMFFRAFKFNQDIGNWNVSNVTNMSDMFARFGSDKKNGRVMSFNQDIGKWDVSKVTDMSHMFAHSDVFNQDIGDWNVSNVTDMSGMFTSFLNSATVFNQDIGKWDVSKVTDMSAMFNSATVFNQDIGKWDVSKVTDMSAMFKSALSFNQNLTKWCVTNTTTEPDDFSSGSALTAANKPVWGTCPSN